MNTALGGGQRRSPYLLYAGAVLVSSLLGAAAYVVLVVRENVAAAKYTKKADELQSQIDQAVDYLRRHSNIKGIRLESEETAAELKRRIPYGPIDLTVGTYIDRAAQQAGIIDERWNVAGGIKVPKAQDDKRSAVQRLSVEMPRLQSSSIDVSFTSRYKDFLAMMRALAEAPWPIEVIVVEITRIDTKGPKLNVHISTRYLYE